MNLPPILDVGGVLISSDIITEYFCCDYEKCKGICCVEGDAGAPVTMDEIAAIEDLLDEVWPDLSASAQSVIDRQGVAYTDKNWSPASSTVGTASSHATMATTASAPWRKWLERRRQPIILNSQF